MMDGQEEGRGTYLVFLEDFTKRYDLGVDEA